MTQDDQSPKSQLKELGLRPKKSWGQNFLHNESVLRSIANHAAKPGEIVLEIGAGLGHLTRQLLANGATVYAIERDRDMANALRQHFADVLSPDTPLHSEEGSSSAPAEAEPSKQTTEPGAALDGQRSPRPSLTIIEDNALTYDFAAFAAQHASPPSVVGNLPYHITSPILFRLLAVIESFSRVTCMVQKEVCDRIVAAPGTDDYSALSALISARAQPKKLLNVSREAFYPVPNVDSAVFQLTPLDGVDASFWNGPYRAMVNASFHARRKTIWNNLRATFPPQKVEETLAALSIEPTRRAETLSPKDFWSLAEKLSSPG